MADESEIRRRIRRVQAQHQAIPEMMRGARVPYTRRGEMSIPAFRMKAGGNPAVEGREQSLRIMRKARELPVDFFFFDLEDATPDHPEYKVWARRFACQALAEMEFPHKVVAFRPNNIRTPYFEDDIVEVVGQVGDRLQALVLPKTESADEVRDVVTILEDIQRLRGRSQTLWLEVLIESPRAFLDAERIAAIPSVMALILGSWDLARTVGGQVVADSWLTDQSMVRQTLPMVAAAHGKDAVDAITGTLPIRPPSQAGAEEHGRYQAALDLARRDAENARRCGFAAKWILHPDQIEPIQSAWTPSREDALRALKLVADYARAAVQGSGSELRGQQLTDKAVVGAEWWTVEAAHRAGVLQSHDVESTGLSWATLRRTVRTRD